MGRPLSKNLFGVGTENLIMTAWDSNILIQTYVTTQMGTKTFQVAEINGGPFYGEGTLVSYIPTQPGELYLEAVDNANTTFAVTKIMANTVVLSNGNVKPWSFGLPTGSTIQLTSPLTPPPPLP